MKLEQQDEPKSILEHVIELKKKFFITLGFFLVGTGIGHIFHDQIIRVIFLPLHGKQLVFMSITDPVVFIFKIDFFIGFLVALPIISWMAFKFITPAFKQKNISKILSFFIISVSLLLAATCYTYFVIAPLCTKFLLKINVFSVQNLITAQSYISFLLSLLLISSIVFQIPLIMAIGTSWGFINPYKVVKMRGWVYMGIVLGVGLFVPPDMFSHLITVVPTLAIFELSTLMCKIIYKKRLKNKKAEEQNITENIDSSDDTYN